jgi:DNA-binding SARP family transcriptional activator
MTNLVTTVRLTVLGELQLVVDGIAAVIPTQAQRLLALLAVREHQPRTTVCGMLWADASQMRAQANLRNAAWQVRMHSRDLLRCDRLSVGLRPGAAVVDLVEARRQASQAMDGVLGSGDALREDLLPLWDEEWLVMERERQRQLRLHALEALSANLCGAGRFPEAVDAALAAVRAEPLRESAQQALVRAHLAEGNVHEAVRQLDLYRRQLDQELGIGPGAELVGLVRDALDTRRARRGDAAADAAATLERTRCP